MPSSSSDSEPEPANPSAPTAPAGPVAAQQPARLGKCEVCDGREAIYTCPKCEVKTCRIECVNIHKKELECDGVRDRTKFVRMKDFTNSDLLSDYRLLEECARFVYCKKRDDRKRFTRIDKELPIHLFKLKNAARMRGIALQFLAQNFTRHINNTTFYDWKSNVISWRVEWLFPNAEPEPIKFVDRRCEEVAPLSVLLDKYINPNVVKFEGFNSLGFYHGAGFNGVKILLKAEKVRGSAKKYFELDPTESLGENLAGKCIVEFPIICVVLKDHAYNFEIVASDDEFDYDVKKDQEQTNVNETTKESFHPNGNSENISHQNNDTEVYPRDQSRRNNKFDRNRGKRNRNRELLTEKFAKEKKLELAKEIKAEKKKKRKNLLFTTGYSSEESYESDDSVKDDKICKIFGK